MIHYVTTRAHGYTVKHLIERQGAEYFKLWSYEDLFFQTLIPTGTWVFTDLERLHPKAIQRAARIAKQIQRSGARVLNDPVLVRSRFELLRRMEEAGINLFSVYRADSNPHPRRFPVFIRNEYDHISRGLTLIKDQIDLDGELERLEANGKSLIGKLVIEYGGEEFLPQTWRRFSSYCVGSKVIGHHVGFDNQWIVKDGFDSEQLETHPNKEELLSIERTFVTQNKHKDILQNAFAIARINYGRADFSIYKDRVQIFEINTNPTHGCEEEVLAKSHPGRRASLKRSEDELNQAIRELHSDRPPRQSINSFRIARK